jgi:hypothetical protein
LILANQLDDPPEPTIAELVHQLVEDATAFVRAEVNLYKTIALHHLAQVKVGAAAIAAGGLLLLGALIVLLVMIAQGLAVHIGPVAAGIVVAIVTSAAGYLLIRTGAARLAALGEDDNEQQVPGRGERKR